MAPVRLTDIHLFSHSLDGRVPASGRPQPLHLLVGLLDAVQFPVQAVELLQDAVEAQVETALGDEEDLRGELVRRAGGETRGRVGQLDEASFFGETWVSFKEDWYLDLTQL